MTGDAPFTEADARFLRERQPACQISAVADPLSMPPQLQRYCQHYGFDKLAQLAAAPRYDFRFERWSGYSVARHQWHLANAKANVLVVHGLFDHTGLYLPLIERLLSEGYAVTAFDLPGHGLTSGQRASVRSFRDYTRVLADCIASLPPTEPLFAVGQSTGCAVIMDLLQAGQAERRPDKVVLLAPLVRVYGWTGIKLMLRLVGRLIKGIPRRFGVNSHDPNFLEFLEDRDPLQPREITTAWVRAMRDWEAAFQRASTVSTPALVIQGTNDKTVDWRRNLPLIERKFSHLHTRRIEGAMHHLVGEAEPWRGQMLDSLCAYLAEGGDASERSGAVRAS